jgi:hypothetical protein
MGALPQALKIIFEVQRINEKITRRKISFPTYKTCFFFFLLFGPLFLSNPGLSYFLFILNDLKCYKNIAWSSINHVWTLTATKQHTKNFLDVQEPALEAHKGTTRRTVVLMPMNRLKETTTFHCSTIITFHRSPNQLHWTSQ